MSKSQAKHGRAHEVIVIAVWVVGAIIAIRLLPTLIADLSNMVAMVTGGIAAVNVSPGSSTATNGASSTSSLPPAYSSQPNSGNVATTTAAGSGSGSVSTSAASTGSAVTAGRYLAPPSYWGAQPARNPFISAPDGTGNAFTNLNLIAP